MEQICTYIYIVSRISLLVMKWGLVCLELNLRDNKFIFYNFFFSPSVFSIYRQLVSFACIMDLSDFPFLLWGQGSLP